MRCTLLITIAAVAFTYLCVAQQRLTNDRGKRLFVANCGACHNPTKIIVGPPFQQIRKDYDWPWIRAMVRNHDSMMTIGESRSDYLNIVFRKSRSSAVLDHLSDKDINDILDYVDSFPYEPGHYQHRKMSDNDRRTILEKISNSFGDYKQVEALLDSFQKI